MTIKLLHSLKFQITVAMLLLLSLFAFSISFTLYSIDAREKETAILQVVNRLQLITNYMDVQSLNYLNTSLEVQKRGSIKHDTYLTQLKDQLKDQLSTKNEIISCFADQHLLPELIDQKQAIDINLTKNTSNALQELQTIWNSYFQELLDKLNNSDNSSQLTAAARYIVEHQKNIKTMENNVVKQLQDDITNRIHKINYVNKSILAISFVLVLLILVGFYTRVTTPINQAVSGFNKVASGDFGHQVRVPSNNELSLMTNSFNHLSQRLYAIFKLIDRIQQGSDLDSTLAFIAQEFSAVLPINWTSVLLHNGNTTILELQSVYADGKAQVVSRTLFSVPGTLLEKAMQNNTPLLISNLQKTAKNNNHYVFLRLLAKAGMESAIFLHLSQTTQVPGMLVLASRNANAYNEEHIELLSNIAHLLTHSFAKTVKMAEQSQLAAIGEFTSGIVHEVRNPLTTIGLALKYFSKQHLDEDGKEWAEISQRQAERIKRLLEDVLLYAKPVKLHLAKVLLPGFIKEFIDNNKQMGELKKITFSYQEDLKQKNNLQVNIDSDRFQQIFLNIYQNAIDASPVNSTVSCALKINSAAHTISIIINNQGKVIDPAIITRIGEPFFTTKTRGTGLGMSIVKRMVEAHSGRLSIFSCSEKGTDMVITLPLFS